MSSGPVVSSASFDDPVAIAMRPFVDDDAASASAADGDAVTHGAVMPTEKIRGSSTLRRLVRVMEEIPSLVSCPVC
jgi:hypothetical protein